MIVAFGIEALGYQAGATVDLPEPNLFNWLLIAILFPAAAGILIDAALGLTLGIVALPLALISLTMAVPVLFNEVRRAYPKPVYILR